MAKKGMSGQIGKLFSENSRRQSESGLFKIAFIILFILVLVALFK